MKNGLMFAIDVDGVVRDILTQMILTYNNRYGDYYGKISMKDFTEYDLAKFDSPAIANPSYWFFDLMAHETFYLAKPYENALEAMHILSEMGDVTLVTKQTCQDAITYTVKWLYKYDVPYDNLCFVSKRKGIVGNNFDYFVDDYVKNFEHSNAKTNILIRQPYNTNLELFDKNFILKDDLYQFANDLKHGKL